MVKKAISKIRHDLDRYCMFCIVFFVIYTLAEMAVSSITGVTHDRLTEAVQWFCGGELFMCAMLKRLKIKKEAFDYGMDSKQLGVSSDSSDGNSRVD